jgi:integrase
MDFRTQADSFITEIANRQSGPARANTLKAYRSLLSARILPLIGGLDMKDVGNKTAKVLVASLVAADLSAATITLAVSLVKQIVKSAVDDEGNQLYPRTWNTRFIDAPKVDKSAQKCPIATEKALSSSVARSKGEVGVLVALLAGTGLRVGEALSLMVGEDDGVNSFWDAANSTLNLRTTLVDGQVQNATKTKAGTRVVDLDARLNDVLRLQFANAEGRLFRTSERTLRRQIEALGIHGFHSMRRFRITHLQAENVPQMLTKFWAGHQASDQTEKYTKMGSKIQERKIWAEKVGLGFTLA